MTALRGFASFATSSTMTQSCQPDAVAKQTCDLYSDTPVAKLICILEGCMLIADSNAASSPEYSLLPNILSTWRKYHA